MTAKVYSRKSVVMAGSEGSEGRSDGVEVDLLVLNQEHNG